ncbi:MAG: hypothetical protein B7C54_01580 [Acidimicrobiales bacterium mtb01]|nr:MAG: hypothetical protein B7C54_01580 [Acidimicrobiales bacterium mtb01]
MRVGHSLDGGGGAPTDSFIGSKIGQHSQIITEDGVHDSQASPGRPSWDDGRRAQQRWLVRIRVRPGSSAALICFLDRA